MQGQKRFASFLYIERENIDDKTEISNAFNIFFADVGKKLSHCIKYNGSLWNKGWYLL